MHIVLLATVLLAADLQPTSTSASRLDWFKDARYGVFMHFLPDASRARSLSFVDKFDVDALAGQLEAMGARYLVITLGQNSGYFNAPNAAYDKTTGYAPGERCAKRDLPLDLYRALHAKGIRLMLYLPCQAPNRDARAQQAFGLAQGPKDQPIDVAFARKWAQVIQEWADRYGDKVCGWWFDGGYKGVHFDEAIARIYADAVKHGNPQAIVTFNPGVKLIRYTQAEDYTAGELNKAVRGSSHVPLGRRLAMARVDILGSQLGPARRASSHRAVGRLAQGGRGPRRRRDPRHGPELGPRGRPNRIVLGTAGRTGQGDQGGSWEGAVIGEGRTWEARGFCFGEGMCVEKTPP